MAADELYASIVTRLRGGATQALIEDAAQLVMIAPDQERAHTLRGIVLLHARQLDEAAAVLRSCIAEFGETGAALTNLAKVHSLRGEQELAQRLLRRALSVDPNQNAALMWFATLRREAFGETGLHDAFMEIAAEPNSWRALLWLAREALDRNELDAALALYGRALAKGFDSDALLMITGDLAPRGYPQHAVQLVAKRYDPSRDDELVGFNLLNCYLDLKQREEGARLMADMAKAKGPDVEVGLATFAEAFAKN